MRALLITCTTVLLLFCAFTPGKKNKLKLPAEFVRVPGGTYYAGNEDEPFDKTKRKSIMGFYISKYEISNLQYRQFFSETASGLTDAEREKIMSDSSGWNDGPIRYCGPMTGNARYYRHPAFNDFPVVNINYEGAVKYCEWLQQKIQKDNPRFEVDVKLPTKAQWTWAAGGAKSMALYPWVPSVLINKKGEYMCNFKVVGDNAITKNSETGLPEIKSDLRASNFLMTVKSFYPSDWGMYNMSGNAAEIVAERGICMGGSWDDYGGDVTIRSEAHYEKFSPTIGFRPIIIVNETK